MNYIYDLHQTLVAHNLILVYEGEFTQEITKSVLAMVERNMDSSGEESGVKRKVFNVMVESLQNIVKHGEIIDETGNRNHKAIFMVGRGENEYTIISGNPIKKHFIPTLEAKLTEINGLDRDGLKALYKEVIKNTEISEKGGAGLGFIDMARKSGKQLDFVFEPINDEYSFFCLKAAIERL
ncbi:MAG: SiaB family protein kinase [Bacteroidota bacterium]